ncbi:par-3 family cell polarity regulator beta a isoform 1-T1 [Synchiropus picturatus]
MKVTVTFGDTAVVVPCKPGWTVRDLMDQATRRYRRILEQHGSSAVRTHHLEYNEGGILDIDDLLSDLVEDRDKLMAVFEEVQREGTDSPREYASNGDSSAAPSPEPLHYYSHLQLQESNRGEIEVNEAVLKANTPLLVRSSSDSALAPKFETQHSPHHQRNGTHDIEVNNVLKAALERTVELAPKSKMDQVNFSSLTKTVNIAGDRGPLGIHVVPYCSSLSGRTLGLHIKGIEERSRSKRENIFQVDECIVKINDTALQDKTFAQSQEVFRQAMSSSVVNLEVLPVANKPRYEKSLIGQLFSADGKELKAKSPMLNRAKADFQLEPKMEMKKAESRPKTPDASPPPVEHQPAHQRQERISPTPPARAASSSPSPRIRSESPQNRQSPVLPTLANIANRKGGKRIKIDLKKGAEGLGFTVVTRDSSVHGPGPILVKNILQRGAAVKDGRLQPGDRILEVNGVDMTNRSQEELVAMLRSTKQGESVSVVVARQEDIFLPRELKGEETGSLLMEDGREQLMYEVPLNETGSAGLGVSLKGNKSRETGEDLGIFIKSIIHGGAAYKDGRLSVNDQLIAVNGESLLRRSNHAAMETLRRSMSSEGNARGTIQLVVLRAPRQPMGGTNPTTTYQPNSTSSQQPKIQMVSNNQSQDNQIHDGYQGTQRPTDLFPTLNGAGYGDITSNTNSRSALYPVASTNGSHGHYGNDMDEDDDLEEGFPPPPSPGAVEEMNRELAVSPTHHRVYQSHVDINYTGGPRITPRDNIPRNRASKSMDLVADESNMESLVGHSNDRSAGETLGPTLGLWKSSSLESLQTAMSEAQQSRVQTQVPFHRPRPHVVRGRGCNQSFRIAIDKSYDGPSEDDDDMSEQSSGHETAASSSSRQGLDEDNGPKKKVKGKKKDKKLKGKKKLDAPGEDLEKKTKKKFGILRFGRKKEDKSKEAAKMSKSKLEALSEEELYRNPDSRDGYDARYPETHSGYHTPDMGSFPDVEDDDNDPNYARINNFRQPPSPQSYISRTPSPAPPVNQHLPSADELEGLYAKVNKPRPPPADSDPRLPGLRPNYPQARAVPGYEDLDAARRRVLDYDPNRMAPRAAETRPAHLYEEVDLQYQQQQPRRDPYDYPTHSRPHHRVPLPQPSAQPPGRHHPTAALARQDIPASPTTRGRHYYEAVGGASRGASPGRYKSPERYPAARGRYGSPERYSYEEDRQPDGRRKNPLINAV